MFYRDEKRSCSAPRRFTPPSHFWSDFFKCIRRSTCIRQLAATRNSLILWSKRIAASVSNGGAATSGLPENHPLIIFFRNPNSSRSITNLDDTIIYSAFSMLRSSPDALIAQFCDRILSRQLLKSIDLLAMAKHDFPREMDEGYEKAVQKLRAVIEEKIDEWQGGDADREGRILFDFAERKIYRNMGEERSLNDIWIREGGNLVRLRERSESVRAIGTFFAIRTYVDEKDEEARQFVEECVSTAAKGEAS